MPNIKRSSALSLFSRSFAPAARKQPDPTPTHTVSGELHQIHAYSSAMRVRISYLAEALGPSVVGEVGKLKRDMKDSHRVLEMLQQRVYDDMIAELLEQTTNEAWKVYQGLVALEARLKELEPVRPDTYIPTGARNLAIAEAKPTWFARGSLSLSTTSITAAPSVRLVEAEHATNGEDAHLPDGEVEHLLDYEYENLPNGEDGNLPNGEDENEVSGEPAWSAYTMSGALPPHHNPVRDTGNRTVDLLEASSGDEDSIDSIADSGLSCTRDASPGTVRNRSPESDHIPPKLTKTRVEVEQSCREEESIGFLPLQDPDRRREGSVPAYFAAFSVMAGLDDPDHFLPRLVYIKVHEVKRLKEWLETRNYLTRSGNISRTEKLLHLIFLLQDGVRFETIAVMFSRTPSQVETSCQHVFEGLMQLHSETALPERQPACDHLWRISHKYFAEPSLLPHVERYYGWWAVDLVKVLVTLNLYIGRYRQQGRVALDGGYFEWWKAFRERKATTTRHFAACATSDMQGGMQSC